MNSDTAPWLFADPYAYQYSDLSAHVSNINCRPSRARSHEDLRSTAAGSERVGCVVSTVQPQHFRCYELDAPSIIVPSRSHSARPTELEGFTIQNPAKGSIELAGDEMFFVSEQAQQPLQGPRQAPIHDNTGDREIAHTCLQDGTRTTYHKSTVLDPSSQPRCETTICSPQASAYLPISRPQVNAPPSNGPVGPTRPKSAMNFDDILKAVEQDKSKLGLKNWEIERARGRRYKARFDSGN
ncbi:hypothetical protein AB5N19_05945 [Seiridium cardinale]|uniref:Uncharacterized protein n=1 Tax=Seiridium cardinale TaxID=138064 RepID=A0ABR2Y5A9_9PEZI